MVKKYDEAVADKHTQGEWHAVGHWVEHSNDTVGDICNCNPESMGQESMGRSDEESMANARLIAHLPEFLHFVRLVAKQQQVAHDLSRKAKMLIANATGVKR
jgi:hypothetical protein